MSEKSSHKIHRIDNVEVRKFGHCFFVCFYLSLIWETSSPSPRVRMRPVQVARTSSCSLHIYYLILFPVSIKKGGRKGYLIAFVILKEKKRANESAQKVVNNEGTKARSRDKEKLSFYYFFFSLLARPSSRRIWIFRGKKRVGYLLCASERVSWLRENFVN